MKSFLAALLSSLLIVFSVARIAEAQVPGFPAAAPTEAGAASRDAQPSLDDLIRILENDATRAKLIESLKAAAYQAPDAPADTAGAGEGMNQSLPARLAAYGGTLLGGVVSGFEGLAAAGSEARQSLAGTGRLDLPRIFEAALPVTVVAIAAFVTLFATWLAEDLLFRNLAARAARAGPLKKLSFLIVSIAVEACSVTLAWAAGHFAAVAVYGTGPSNDQSLFLNALLTIELIKVAMGGLIAPRYPALRMTPFGDRNAAYWYFWLSRLVSLIGYAFLFVAPLVQQSSSAAAAEAVRFLAAVAALVLISFLIVQNRHRVRHRLGRSLAGGEKSLGARTYAALGAVWHVLALAYVLALFVAWLISPNDGLPFIATATLISLAALSVGGLVVSVIARIIAKGVTVPERTRERLPLLERHINSFIPTALTVVRLMVIAVVIGAVLDAWSIFDLSGWLATPMGQRFLGGIAGAAIVLVIAFAVFLTVSSWIEFRLNPNFGRIPSARERTLLALFRNGFTATLAVIAVMLVLSQLGIDIAPLLAGAGVVGLAVGFGAQKLVQDVITGAFIQLENAMNEGDVVQVSGISGVVERLTVRSVSLRSLDGTYHLIPFSSVTQVANMTKDFSNFVADVSVAYREDTASAKAVMREAFDLVRASSLGQHIIADFEMMGVDRLSESAVVVRGRIRTLPGKQWEVGRAYNETLKRLCDERGIELPFPQTTVWFGENKNGKTPPLRIDGGGSAHTVQPPGAAA